MGVARGKVDTDMKLVLRNTTKDNWLSNLSSIKDNVERLFSSDWVCLIRGLVLNSLYMNNID